MIILQIAPEIGPGTGVGAVAHHLEQEWRALGHDVRRFTLSNSHGDWIPKGSGRLTSRLGHAARVVWFSTVGTAVARGAIARLPDDAVSICHNDVLTGDVYVNHGILQAAMRARGQYYLRMARNPLHLFTSVRDRIRYRSPRYHRFVVNLTEVEESVLRSVYGRIAPRLRVIGNGIDTERFQPVEPDERARQRQRLGVTADDLVSLFVGHEYGRKGLDSLVEAMAQSTPEHHLVVVGGDLRMRRGLRERVEALGIGARVHVLPPGDPRPLLAAADVLVQPSHYESYGLVVLEALAAGVPVISTPVGCAADLLEDGAAGFLTTGTPEDLVACLRRLQIADRARLAGVARELGQDQDWRSIAVQYLDLFRDVQAVRRVGVAP